MTEDWVTYGVPPHKFEAGTPPIVQAIGLGAALKYMESLGREAIRAHEADLGALRAGAAFGAELSSASSATRRGRARSSPSR